MIEMENERLIKDPWTTGGNGPSMPEDKKSQNLTNEKMEPGRYPNMLTTEIITAAYHDLAYAKEALYNALETEIGAKEILEKAKNELLCMGLEGPINGKNAEQREAQLRESTKVEYAGLKIAEANKRKAALDTDLSAMKCQEYKEILKLLSLRGA
jgi:hypothetical protein